MKQIKSLEAVAFSRYIRMSPFKIRRILDQIRGRSYEDTMVILSFMPYKACPVILNTVQSAAANAINKYNIDPYSLIISEARADAGPILKRLRPHAQGRGFLIKKRMSHIISLI
jgi:large subunit ribosomal protein L22